MHQKYRDISIFIEKYCNMYYESYVCIEYAKEVEIE